MNNPVRILIAESNTDFLKMVEDSLKNEPGRYIMEKASTGKECMEKLKEKQYDLLLLGHLLTDGEGLGYMISKDRTFFGNSF